LPRARARRTRDLGNIRGIKDEKSNVLVEEEGIKKGWQSYFYKFSNGELIENSQRRE